jgi:hypothetical protein
MKKVFIDKDGACEWESFNIGKTTRPYIEVSNDVDLSKKCIENGQLRDKTSAEIEDEIYNAELVLIQQKRREEYGNVEDQLDEIYHGGLDAWRSRIGAVKAKHPKPKRKK